ncbi:MAG: rsec15 [Lentinula lateritia]|uniref:Exocyst complex component SEC15 n=1 Tax=Lentinula lateritia TaxID=40482 RepID=A0ABQ8VN15_9AGAR|nr:rsec15 [Lentinula novae-zelandiae]KAJ3928601.1 MAG: rsec15 [Lentinula lateritia]KAJ4497780.1 exocyst complex component, sec15 subunit [Lentinula lateritia]
MPPRKRTVFTQESIDQQLQQIHLLDQSSSSENLEQLGPIIKQIHTGRQQDAFLRSVQALVDSKDAEIERICGENYQDFISSVSTLFTVKSYTDKMKENISSLDASVSQLGRGLVEKKRALLQTKKTAANLDEAIDNLQACLRVLDVVHRVGEMIREGKYWSALRSLEDIQNLPQTSLSQTPFYRHLLSSLPSLRVQIKDAVTASMKEWLLKIRENSGEIGRLALEAMEIRTRRWRSRRDKDPLLRMSRVGSAVELVTYEKTEFNVLDNDKLTVDFKPLYQCIHIYTTLDSLDELQRSYQADRKIQSDLILPIPLPLGSLPAVTQEISGYFIVETHVLETTGTFRSGREVEELWEGVVSRLTVAVQSALRPETDPDSFLHVKECLIGFITTLESPLYSTTSLHSFLIVLFEKYAQLLEKQFSKRFDDIVWQDDCQPMYIQSQQELKTVLDVVWISDEERAEVGKVSLPQSLPWSQTFYLCCEDIRGFIQKFYAFVEGVSQHHRNIDDLLSKSLDNLLINHICSSINNRLAETTNLSQLAQIVTNAEHFQVACEELERSLTSLRTAQRGGTIRLKASSSFDETFTRSVTRIKSVINSKLDDFFELSEYNWVPTSREEGPNMYLYELVNWLTTVVDSQLLIASSYIDEAYMGAAEYIAECFMDFLAGRNIAMMNENAISNLLVDCDFLENEFGRIGRPHLSSAFNELRLTTRIVLADKVQEYLIPANRQNTYAIVKHKRLQALLEKLAQYGSTRRDAPGRQLGEKRRKEADAVGRLFPGQGR